MNAVVKIPTSKAALTPGNPVAAMVPNSIESAWRLSEIIAASDMAPKTYGTNPNKIMVGILAGMEIGLTPMAALQSIAVINGNPSLWGDGALALALASNLVEDMDETDDGETATCTIKRLGRATPIVRTFSNADAQKAGLKGKAGPWTQYPARMRQMRARAFALRDGFPDVLKGLRVAEEARDYADFAEATPRPATGVTVPLSGAMLLEQADADTDRPSPAPPADAGDPTNASAGAEAGPQQDKEAATRDWVSKTLSMIDATDTRAELDGLMAKRATGLAKVRAVLPSLADEVETVAELKGRFFGAMPDDDGVGYGEQGPE